MSAITSVGQWRAWQRRALPRLPSGRVLEMAHGTGDTLIDLAEAGFQPIGIDQSPYMGGIARRKLARRGLRLPLVRGRAEALPFASGSFPAIVATFPTEYIIEPKALAEFHRVLQSAQPASGRPAGRLVFVPVARITGDSMAHRLAAWLFSATGQAGPWPPQVEARYRAARFRARTESDLLPWSEVVIVIAEKADG